MSYPANSLWRASQSESIVIEQLSGQLDVDFAIIGGGFTACSAALEAARSGASVCLLEAEHIGYGGSGRNVGLVNAGLWLPQDDILKKMGKSAGEKLVTILGKAPNTVFDLISTYNIECETQRHGTLQCAHSKAGLENLKRRHEQGNRYGTQCQLLSAQETRQRTGSPRHLGGLFYPLAGTIQPLSYCQGLAKAAQAQGAKLFQQSPVTQVTRKDGYWTLVSQGHSVRARSVLMATNAYHQNHLADYKPEYARVNFFQLATEPLSKSELLNILPGREGCWDTATVMTSFRLDNAGRLIIGSVGNLDGAGGKIHKNWAMKKLHELFPQLGSKRFEYTWTGQIAMTADHIPKILDLGPNALASFGYSGRGIAPGTVFGKACANALLSGDYSHLPIDPVPSYQEHMASLREAYYEIGASVTHATGLNI